MNRDPACIFCKIIQGELPSTRVYEDPLVVAFMDIAPWTPGHCLVVPKEHAATIFEISDESLAAVTRAAKELAPALRDGLGADGLNLFQSNGSAAWQTVDHFHLHMLPRRIGDGLQPPSIPEQGDPGDIERSAEAIKSAIKGGN